MHSVDEVLAACRAADIPAGPVWDIERARRQLEQQGSPMLQTLAHPVFGPMQFMLQPARFSDESSLPRRDPMLGEHTAEVLEGLGLTEAEIDRLTRKQAT